MKAGSAIRFLFVTGKGGVGKSTVALALGLSLASRGRKTLVVAASGSTQLTHLVGRAITTTPVEVAPRLFSAFIDPEEAMREYVESALHSRWLSDALFHRKFSRGFLYGIPGLRPWALLGKAWYYSEKERSGPSLPEAPFDTVIVDAPATGDSTDLLRVPRIITEVAPLGRLRRDAEACWTMLRDPRQTRIVAVTLPEDLPVTETCELVAVVREELGLPLGPLVVNQRSPELLSARLREKLSSLDRESLEPEVRSVFRAAERRALREQSEETELVRLRGLGLPLLEIPRFSAPPQGISGLTDFAAHLTHFWTD